MLSFAAPAFLGLAALTAVVLLLHSRRQRRHVVGSLQIWRALQLPAGSRQARRHIPPLSLELILQIAAVLALALALAQPFLGRTPPPRHLVVVLDASGSMAVDEDGRGRLDLAREALAARLGGQDRLGPERVSLVVAGVSSRLEAARWPWRPDALEEALARQHATDGPADWDAAARLLTGVLRTDEPTAVLFVSAGPAPASLRDAAGAADLREIAIGTPHARPHIAAQALRQDGDGDLWQVSGTVALPDGIDTAVLEIIYSPSPDAAPLPWTEKELSRGSNGTARFNETLDLPGDGILTIRLAGDTGQRGNTARLVLASEAGTLEVLYLGPGDQPLLSALRAIEGVEIYQADTLPQDLSRFGLVVVDGIAVPRLPETNTVWIGAARIEGMPEPAPLDAPDPDMWDDAHRLGRDIDWSAIRITSARALPPQPLARTLLASQGNPLVRVWEMPQGRAVQLAFDPADSNWPGHSSFALLAAGLIDWLGLEPGGPARTACDVGRRCPLDARLAGRALTEVGGPQDAAPLRLSDPTAFRPERAGLFQIPAPGPDQRPGRYLAVNAAPAPDDLAAPAGMAPAPVLPRSWTIWLLALAAVLMTIESFLATRRKGRATPPAPLGLAAAALAAVSAFDLPVPRTDAREAMVLIMPPALGEGTPTVPDPRLAALERARPGTVSGAAHADALHDAGARPAVLPATGPGPIPDGATALEIASAMIPSWQSGRIVLGADLATAPPEMPAGLRQGVTIDRLADPAPVAGELLMRGIELPRRVVAGDAVPLVGLVHAKARTDARIHILRDGAPIATQDVALAPGNNRIETVLPRIPEGETLVEMEVSSPGDTYAENNRAGRIVTATPARPIAVLSSSPEHGNAFARMLAAEGLEALAINPRSAPQYQEGWLGYGGIVLLDMPAIALSTRQQGLIETAVSEHGLGLLILGGPNSFGPGGYYETAIERLSPLSSRIPRDAPEVAMVFVLDRSGSMQQPVGTGNRLDIAKRATLAAAELLNPASQIGIIVFDAEATAVLPIGTLDLARTARALEGVDPGGGTSIHPGLVRAFEMLRDVEAPARHIVVMTDGLSQPGDFPGILARIRAEGITASAVAVGQGSDLNTVEMIAGLGGGAAHASSDFQALPSILSQEAMLLSAPIEEIRTRPRWIDHDAAFLEGLPDPMPPIEGFVLTTAKPEARLAMVAPDTEQRDMPVMAWWRYGNGSVLALSTEATGPWSRHWHGLDSYTAMWGRVLRQFQPTTAAPGTHLDVDGDGETLHVTLTALDEDGTPRTGLALIAEVGMPGPGAASAPLREESAGLYRAGIPLGAPGRYDIAVSLDGQGGEVTAAFHHAYPARYDLSRSDGGAARLAAATGGSQRDAPQIVAAGAGTIWVWRGIWPVWALLALGTFMVELVRRYAGFRPRHGRNTAKMQGSSR